MTHFQYFSYLPYSPFDCCEMFRQQCLRFNHPLKASHVTQSRVINVDKNLAYPVAIELLESEQTLAGEIPK
jgi:hypothetical protein